MPTNDLYSSWNNRRQQTVYTPETLYKRAAKYDLSSFEGKNVGELWSGRFTTKSDYSLDTIFREYRNGLDKESFVNIFSQTDDTKKEKYLNNEQLEQLHDILDVNEDGIIEPKEFQSFSMLNGHGGRLMTRSDNYKIFDSTDLKDLIEGSKKYKTEHQTPPKDTVTWDNDAKNNEIQTPPKGDGKPHKFAPGEEPIILVHDKNQVQQYLNEAANAGLKGENAQAYVNMRLKASQLDEQIANKGLFTSKN